MRNIVITLVLLAAVALLLPNLEILAFQGQGDGGQSEIQRGFQIAPVPLTLTGKSRGLVGLGSYLVNGPMDCTGCHTVGLFLPGGNPFAGDPTTKINTATYLAGGNPFGPGVVSRNITPDKDGHPAGLTYAQFELAMRNGADYKLIHPRLQVMPWPAFRYSTNQTLQAIYEYLSSIPCKEGGPGITSPRC